MASQPAPKGPYAPKLWRSTKKRRASSVDSATSSVEGGYTFGMKAPIVDFFEQDYITKFAPLEDILLGKADDTRQIQWRKRTCRGQLVATIFAGFIFLRTTWSGLRFDPSSELHIYQSY
jgi:hypothetical protein